MTEVYQKTSFRRGPRVVLARVREKVAHTKAKDLCLISVREGRGNVWEKQNLSVPKETPPSAPFSHSLRIPHRDAECRALRYGVSRCDALSGTVVVQMGRLFVNLCG